MRSVRRAAVTGLMALWLAPLPALAGSQSSNSSTDCSNGRCTRVESLFVEDRHGRRGWVREERWHEGARRRDWRGRDPDAPPGWMPRRGRDRDDD